VQEQYQAAVNTLSDRIGPSATQPVPDAADRALRFVIDLALGAARTPDEMRKMMNDTEANVIAAFAGACRDELRAIR
jgi:hypothetical protein